MTRDPLEALLRLRRMTVDQARRDVAACLRIESEAAAAVAAIKASIARETEAATNLAAGDAEVEVFGAWLRRIRPMQHAALAAKDAAETAMVRARTVLGAARAAVRAAEDMLEKRAAAAQAAAEHKAQGEIDEAALRSSADNASSPNRRSSEGAKIFSPSPCGRGLGGGDRGATSVPTPLPTPSRNGRG
jgi:flagellar export protein FliJ